MGTKIFCGWAWYTALLTALMMTDLIPALAAAFIILLGGLGLSYYAALSRNQLNI